MSTTPLDQTIHSRATRAVSEFRKLLPGLTSYARAVTGKKDLRIDMTHGFPYTDGSVIYYRPPLALGDALQHDRSLCDTRDPATLQQRCGACSVLEEVNVNIYHEIAHIAFGTFAEISELDRTRAIKEASRRVKGERIKKRMEELFGSSFVPSYIMISSAISPFMPSIVNALEDVRIDARMWDVRPGTRVMYAADMFRTMDRGLEQADGSIARWTDMPLNHQIMVGVIITTLGMNPDGHLDEYVCSTLRQPDVQALLEKSRDTARSSDTYYLSVDFLDTLRGYGFFLEPEEQEEQDSDNKGDEDQQSSEGDDDGEERQESQEDQEGDSSEAGSPSEADDVPADESEGAGEPDEDSGDSEAGDGDSRGDGEPSGESEPAEGSASDDSPEAESPESEQGDSGGDDPQDGSERDEGDGDGGQRADGGAGDGERGEPESDEPTPHDSSDGASDGGDHQPGQDDSGSMGSEPVDADAGDDHRDSDSSEVDEPGVDEPDLGPLPNPEPLRPQQAEWGDANGLADTLAELTGHHRDNKGDDDMAMHAAQETDDAVVDAAIKSAITLGAWFETPPVSITGLDVFRFDDPERDNAWQGIGTRGADAFNQQQMRLRGHICDMDIPESVLGPALLQTRRTFDDNARKKRERNLKSGKVNARVLGRRAWAGDPRLFHKNRMPGKKSYAVIIGIDVSGSTSGANIVLAKRAAKAQAELCHRVGISFAVYAHSSQGSMRMHKLQMYEIKSFDEPWAKRNQEALDYIGPSRGNLDGHSMRFYRRLVERRPETDKVLMYYTDGAMPATNHAEELAVMQEEIKYCAKRGITLMGVGIRTDSPIRHGLDTVQVDDDSDLIGVVRHLERRILAG